ncbi:transporter C36.03c [Apiospora arundinis]|uniref:Transporter C36.03c n=1 Tax=Apiospora arundinis TaxID=335852 RepID=A0ABR2JN33_9PEZI
MRLDASILGLVTWLGAATASPGDSQYATLATPTKAVSSNSLVAFTLPTNSAMSHMIGPASSKITWSVMKVEIRVTKAMLFVNESGTTRPVAFAAPTGTATTSPKDTKSWHDKHGGPVKSAEPPDSTDDASEYDHQIHGGSFFEKDKSVEARQQSLLNILGDFRSGSGSVTLDPSAYENYNALERRMFLALYWYDQASEKSGRSYTMPFAMVKSNTDPATLVKLASDLGQNGELPVMSEGTTDATDTDPQSSQVPGPPLTGQFPTGAATDSPASAATNSGGTGETQSGGSGGGGSSLNSGAIAGIVVGAVIGVLLIASALAYFLCFRRRASKRHIHGDVGYASDSGAAGMIAREKDMPGVNHSPSSAYADDNGHLHNHGNESTNYSNQDERGVPTGVGAHQQSRDSLAQNDYLYNNSNGDQGVASNRHSAIGMAVSGAGSTEQNSADNRRERTRSVGGVPAGRTSHQTSRPASEARSPSRYAHLIEEGMTEDEIRRLEDEERQLDAAIEDAGRHGGGGRPNK